MRIRVIRERLGSERRFFYLNDQKQMRKWETDPNVSCSQAKAIAQTKRLHTNTRTCKDTTTRKHLANISW